MGTGLGIPSHFLPPGLWCFRANLPKLGLSLSLFFICLFIYFEREKERVGEGQRETERERERSRFCTVGTESEAGLDPMNREIVT